MTRKVFYSFHYKPDNWRAGQVRNIGVVEGNQPASDNDWETVKKGGDATIKRWINDQMHNRSCTVVLVGSQTANRKWIDYEIKKAWGDSKGVVGIYIHGLKDKDGNTSSKGVNPFHGFTVDKDKLSSIVKCYSPSGLNSKDRYAWIEDNLSAIIEEAINIRNQN